MAAPHISFGINTSPSIHGEFVPMITPTRSIFINLVKYGIEVNLFYEVAGQKQYLEVGLEAQLKLQLEQVEPPSDKQVIYE